MYGTIVVGTDGTPTARDAVWHAAELAKALDATLHVVHGYGGTEREALALLKEAIDELDDADVKIDTHAVEGDATDALLEIVDEVGAELIVVGNKGMSPTRFRADGVPNQISHRAACHVLIVYTT